MYPSDSITPLAYLVEDRVLVVNLWNALLSEQRCDAPAIKAEDGYEVGQIKLKETFEEYAFIRQVLNQVSHFILATATENALDQEYFPNAHFLDHDGIDVLKLGVLVPLVDILLLNLDVDLILVWNFLK